MQRILLTRALPGLLFAGMFLACAAMAAQEQTAAAPGLEGKQTGPATNNGPRIEFPEPFFDFGRVESGQVVNHVFEFTNAGNQLLEIQDVWTSCGCTAATNWTRKVEPAKSGKIPIIFDSAGRAGPVTKTVSVACNDPAQPKLVLQFTATIWKPIDAIPTIAAFNFGPDFQTNESRIIQLVSNLEEPVSISKPVCTNSAFRAELKTLKQGKEFELQVTVVPPVAAGSTVAPITLKTSSSNMPVVTVTAYAVVQPSLMVNPPRLRLPKVPLTDPAQFKIRVQNQSTNSLVLSDASISEKDAEVRLREVQPGRLFELNVSFPTGFQIHPGQEIEVRVKSNHPQFPYVRIPVLEPFVSAGEDTTAASGLFHAQDAPAAAGRVLQ